jgi:hypothetical protein
MTRRFFFEVAFNTDNTVLLTDGDTTPVFATGTWAKTGNTINIDYTYESGVEYSLSGELLLGPIATYSGNYYNGHGSIAGNEVGVFEVVLD